MKKIMELVIGVIMMAMVASCFTGENNEHKIENELKDSGWTDILIKATENGEYNFECESLPEFGRTIYIKGVLTYDENGIDPVEMTAYGVDNEGVIRVVGNWDIEDDWVYTEFGEEYLRTVEHHVY